MRRGETRCAFGATLTFMPELGLPISSIFIFGSCKEIRSRYTIEISWLSCFGMHCECIRMHSNVPLWRNLE